MGPVTMGPPQEAPDQAGGLMARGGRLCMEEGVSGARARLLRLGPAAGAFAASFVALLAPPIEASVTFTCRAPGHQQPGMRQSKAHVKTLISTGISL